MTKFFALFGTLLLASAMPLQAEASDPPAMAEAEAADLEGALNRGLDLYRYDQAAWHTTDAMLEDISDPAKAGVRGWVVTLVEAGRLVTYWKPAGDRFEAVYSAVYDGEHVVSRTVHDADNATLTSKQIALIRAGKVPEAAKLERCSDRPFNTVIMPSAKESGSIYVYYLTPQTSNSAIPLGGHYRFEVLDGEVLGQRAFTNNCIELSLTGEQNEGQSISKRKGKGKPSALFISHLLDPTPTEIHVFSVLTARVPIYVAINSLDRLWVIDSPGGKPRAEIIER